MKQDRLSSSHLNEPASFPVRPATVMQFHRERCKPMRFFFKPNLQWLPDWLSGHL